MIIFLFLLFITQTNYARFHDWYIKDPEKNIEDIIFDMQINKNRIHKENILHHTVTHYDVFFDKPKVKKKSTDIKLSLYDYLDKETKQECFKQFCLKPIIAISALGSAYKYGSPCYQYVNDIGIIDRLKNIAQSPKYAWSLTGLMFGFTTAAIWLAKNMQQKNDQLISEKQKLEAKLYKVTQIKNTHFTNLYYVRRKYATLELDKQKLMNSIDIYKQTIADLQKQIEELKMQKNENHALEDQAAISQNISEMNSDLRQLIAKLNKEIEEFNIKYPPTKFVMKHYNRWAQQNLRNLDLAHLMYTMQITRSIQLDQQHASEKESHLQTIHRYEQEKTEIKEKHAHELSILRAQIASLKNEITMFERQIEELKNVHVTLDGQRNTTGDGFQVVLHQEQEDSPYIIRRDLKFEKPLPLTMEDENKSYSAQHEYSDREEEND